MTSRERPSKPADNRFQQAVPMHVGPAGSPSASDSASAHGRLVRRVAAGQQSALRELYDEVSPAMLGIATRVLGEAALAEAAVAEAFVQVWRDASRYDPSRATVRSWVVMIARARAIDLRRRRAAEQRIGAPLEAAAAVDSGISVTGDVSDGERSRVVRDALGSLNREQRAAVEAAFFEGLTHVEVAARLGAPLGTVKSRIRTGLELLRTRLASYHDDDQ